jgi:hypothetical protein
MKMTHVPGDSKKRQYQIEIECRRRAARLRKTGNVSGAEKRGGLR